MRRSTAVAVLGGVITAAGGAWFALVQRDIVVDKHVAGVPLAALALGACAVGAVLLVGGLLVTRRGRKADAAFEEGLEDDDPGQYVWPTIVVRRHGRPRQRPMARIVTVPSSTWPVPSPRHPSMVDADTSFPAHSGPTVGDGWLPDNVQRLPFRP
jgi:hypothetical protein